MNTRRQYRTPSALYFILPLLFTALVASSGQGVSSAAVGDASVRYDERGRYAFPVEVHELSDMTWTRYHWDGGNAVDISAAHGSDPAADAYQRFIHSRVIAVTDGIVQRFDNERGGISLLLRGDDGKSYYYAHLDRTSVHSARRVTAGEPIGVIGNTGRWTQYIEPHLHFEMSSSQTGIDLFRSDINAAEWIFRTFSYRWNEPEIPPYPPDTPRMRPLSERFTVLQDFAAARTAHPDAASVDIRLDEADRAGIVAPLTGEIRVHRNPFFGVRVQITNRPLDETVVISGFDGVGVGTADVVFAGDFIGTAGPEINIMYFRQGVLSDPMRFF